MYEWIIYHALKFDHKIIKKFFNKKTVTTFAFFFSLQTILQKLTPCKNFEQKNVITFYFFSKICANSIFSDLLNDFS